MTEDRLSFEDTFTQLEKAVEQLETGRLPLDDMLALYERAMHLAQGCQELLTQAELRVRQVEVLATAQDESIDLHVEIDDEDDRLF